MKVSLECNASRVLASAKVIKAKRERLGDSTGLDVIV